MKCPDCVGGRRGIPLHVRFARPDEQRTEEELKRLIDSLSKCDRCNGTGKVTDEQAGWINQGSQMKQTRLARKVGLRRASEIYGVEPSVVSQMERGIIKADMTLLAKLKSDDANE